MSTLVSEPFYEDLPKFFGMSLEELRQRRDHDAFLAFEQGLIGEQEYRRRFFKDGTLLDIDGLKDALRQSVRILPGVEDALRQAQIHGTPMYALSNYSVWYEVIDEATGLSRFLDWSFVSCKTGVRKPDPEAYLGPTRALGVEAEVCVFVDDRRANVDSAVSVGMKAILREPDTDLLSAFKAQGVA